MEELQLNGKPYTLVRYKLRGWLKYEEQQEKVSKAVEDQDADAYAEALYELISAALGVSVDELRETPWSEVAYAHMLITNINRLKKIPIVNSKQMNKQVPVWEYTGRQWYWWLHNFAKAYGWTSNMVENLDPDDATALMQEIFVDEQLEREWEWSMSEMAYPYDKNTKKAVFHPMPRPDWMEGVGMDGKNSPIPVVRFKKSMLPVGKIIGEDGSERIVD